MTHQEETHQEETETRKIPFQKMEIIEALQFIKLAIEPDSPPLGMWFGWFQPSIEDEIKIGSAYDVIYPERIRNEDYSYRNPTFKEIFQAAKIPAEYTKDVIRELHQEGIHLKDTLSDQRGLYAIEEVFFPWAELEDEEKLLYRLCILAFNTMTDYHNFACSYSDYLGWEHKEYCLNDIRLYERNDNQDDGLNIIFENMTEFPEEYLSFGRNGYGSYNPNDDYYHYVQQAERESAETLETIKEWFDYGLNLKGNPTAELIEYIFPNDIPQHYISDDEILPILSWFIDWIKDEYNDGDLSLKYREGMPQELRDLILINTRMIPLPGMES